MWYLIVSIPDLCNLTYFYELVPEAYSQKFRDCIKKHDQTHLEFARTKEQLFDMCCSSKRVGSGHTKLRQLMLVEEFK